MLILSRWDHLVGRKKCGEGEERKSGGSGKGPLRDGMPTVGPAELVPELERRFWVSLVISAPPASTPSAPSCLAVCLWGWAPKVQRDGKGARSEDQLWEPADSLRHPSAPHIPICAPGLPLFPAVGVHRDADCFHGGIRLSW